MLGELRMSGFHPLRTLAMEELRYWPLPAPTVAAWIVSVENVADTDAELAIRCRAGVKYQKRIG